METILFIVVALIVIGIGYAIVRTYVTKDAKPAENVDSFDTKSDWQRASNQTANELDEYNPDRDENLGLASEPPKVRVQRPSSKGGTRTVQDTSLRTEVVTDEVPVAAGPAKPDGFGGNSSFRPTRGD